MDGDYPQSLIENLLSELINSSKLSKLSKLIKQNNKEETEILPFLTQYQPLVSTIKEA